MARELAASGHTVRGVARSRAAAGLIEGLDAGTGRVTAVPGDILDPSSLVDAFAGAGLVVHAAGVVASCRHDPTGMIRTNVLGTRNVVTAAAACGVRRFVHTSSAATIGEGAGEVGREDTQHRGWFLTAYERSKTEAEAVALEVGRDLALDVVVVNPASVQGPGRMDRTTRLLLAAANGRLPVMIRSTLSFVDVADCARGHVLAATIGRSGERYVLCGATLRTEDALALVRSIGREVRSPTGAAGVVGGGNGRPPRRRAMMRSFRPIAVPGGAVAIVAGVLETVFGLVGRDAPICGEVAAAIIHGRAYDGSRAMRELGLEYTSPDETIRRTLSWFREIGKLR